MLERASGTAKHSVQQGLGLHPFTRYVVCIPLQVHSNKSQLAALETPVFLPLWGFGAQWKRKVINMRSSKNKFSTLWCDCIHDMAVLILLWMTLIITLVSVLFIFNIPVGQIQFWIASIGCIYIVWQHSKKYMGIKQYICVVVITIVIVTILMLFCTYMYHNVWDSNSYHKQAIGLLKNGWNPLYQSSDAFETQTGVTQYYFSGALQWAEVYPKATWYFGAVIYFITDQIETAKVYTLLSMFVLFAFVFDYVSRKTNSLWKAIVIAILLAMNPIAMTQFRCFYLDGFANNIILILMLELIILEDQEYNADRLLHWAIVACTVVIGCNLKFSILLFNVVICGFYSIYKLIVAVSDKSGTTSLKKSLQPICLMLGCGLFGVCVVGMSPFLTNIIRYGSLTYQTDQLLEAGLTDFAGIQDCTNSIQAFFVSLFGKMNHYEFSTVADTLKLPFTVSLSELQYYSLADARIGAMGILFSGMFVTSIAVIGVMLWKYKELRKKYKFSILLCIVIFICSAVTPFTFQMRYVGFLIIIPGVSMFILAEFAFNKRILSGMLFVFLSIISFANVFPWVTETINRMNKSADIRAELIQMRQVTKQGGKYFIQLANEQYSGLMFDLQDYDICFEYVSQFSEDQPVNMTFEGEILYQLGRQS